MIAKVIMLVIFFAVMFGVGIYCRKHATDVNGFILGGRSVGPWMTAFAYGTSYFSAVVFIGYAGQFGWKFGLASTWIGLGNAVIGSLLAWVILGRRTRIMSKHLHAGTMPQFFYERFDSKALKVASSVIIFVFLVPYTSSIYNGLSRLFGMAFDIPYVWCVLTMAVLTGAYVILGGYMATAINDFIQGIIMLFGIVAVIAAVLNGQGGFTEAVTKLALIEGTNAAGSAQPGVFASFFGPDPIGLLSVIILTSLGTWGLPQMIQKFYAIKSEDDIAKGTIISTIFAVIIAGGCYFLGGFGRLFDCAAIYKEDGSIAFDSIVPTMLANVPDILMGIVVVLVLSASMSTLSGLVLTSSSTLTLDFLKDNIVKGMKEKTALWIMKLMIVVFIVISVVLALDPPGFIAQLMGISWGALAGAFLAPFLLALYWKGVTKAGVWACFASGVGITVGNMFFNWFSSSITAGAFAMLVGFAVVIIVSLISPKLDKKRVEEIFECYEKTATVPVKKVLVEDEEFTVK
ncbi:MAG: sodium:solute symporter [Lachnospiraceae bacterium]|nr:sodium:solute symporter [Candidatus Colinaster equi]